MLQFSTSQFVEIPEVEPELTLSAKVVPKTQGYVAGD